jgi:hypothetical protein
MASCTTPDRAPAVAFRDPRAQAFPVVFRIAQGRDADPADLDESPLRQAGFTVMIEKEWRFGRVKNGCSLWAVMRSMFY